MSLAQASSLIGITTRYGTYGTETATVASQDGTPTDNTRIGLVVCHAGGGNPTWILDATSGRRLVAELAYTPIHCGAHSAQWHWGNDASQTKIGDAVSWLQGAGGAKSGKVLIYAASMGALAALNYGLANPTKIAAMALGVPVTSLAYVHDNNATYTASIETAYGGAGGYAAAVTAHDPQQHAASYSGLFPIKMWRASNDATVYTSEQDAFATASGAAVRDLGAVGHTDNSMDMAEVRSFLSSYA